jgi:cobalt-zinc-cadmium efflux system membrane fusion protein
MKMNKLLPIGLFLLGFIFLNTGCKTKGNEKTETAFSMSDTMMTRCKFQKAQYEDVKNEIKLFGKIATDNNKTAQVYPIVTGVVKSINVELGDYVKQGQLLASIQSREVASFRKEKSDAQSDLAVAEKNLQVAQDMYAGKLNSEKEVTAAEKEVEKAKTELGRINEVYSIYRLKDGSVYNVTAPISGFVITKRINQNEQLPENISEPLFSIADIQEVWVLANVTEDEIAQIQVGYDAKVKTFAFPDVTYRAKIDKIFNVIDPDTKSMKARIKIPNDDLKLKPEMNCTVAVSYSENKKLIAVPSSSIIFDKSKYWVMVYKDKNNVETRKVDVYRQLDDVTYIQSGLAENETVISENGLLIYDALND